MAAKIVKLFSSSSAVICRRLTTTQHTTAFVVQNFGWSAGSKRKQTKFPHHHFTFIRTMASTGETIIGNVPAEKMEQTELETSTSNNTTNEISLENNLENPIEFKPSSETASPLNAECSSETEEKKLYVRRIKAAILLSYSGQGYFGMQIQNNGTKTIENDLMKAFLDAGVVDKEGFEKPKSLKFQRAARTDKNVSAARNIISIMVPKDGFDVDSINKHLPDQIRIMDYRRVTKGFDAKLQCCSRTYYYMIPTFAFTPLEEKVEENFRITTNGLETLRTTLKLFEGTKNYHNFTSRKKPTDPSAMRFIMSFTSSDPFVKDGLEYVVIKIKGQSFMLHQIRKMIGLVVAILRGYASVEETMKKAFTLDRIDIPMVPGLGLMLGEAHYDHYNKKFGQDGIHEPLIWDNVADKIEAFCQEKIYTEVTRTEIQEKSMFQWLQTVPYHTYDIRDDDNPGGYGPLGKANIKARKERGELSEDEMDDEEEEIPKKKQKQEA